MQLTIRENFSDVQRQLDQLREDVAGRSLASALNKTVAQGKTAMSKGIRAEFNISAAKVADALRIVRATFRKGVLQMEAVLESPTQHGRSINLINFDAHQTAQGVTVRIRVNGGRKLLRGAFIANQGRTVFVREGKKRLPIKALATIGIQQMFNTKRVNAPVVAFMLQKFPEIFAHEAAFYIDRFNRSGR